MRLLPYLLLLALAIAALFYTQNKNKHAQYTGMMDCLAKPCKVSDDCTDAQGTRGYCCCLAGKCVNAAAFPNSDCGRPYK